MIDLNNINKIYIVPGSTDLRLGIDGYAAIVQTKFNGSPFDGSLYIFCNKNHNNLCVFRRIQATHLGNCRPVISANPGHH